MVEIKKIESFTGWYSLEEAYEVSKISKHEIRSLIKSKGIKMQIREGRVFINKDQFDNYLKQK